MIAGRRATATLVVGALLLAAGLLWLWRASAGATRAPDPAEIPVGGVLLPDVGGEIALAALGAASARRSALRNFELVNAIAGALPDETRLLLLTNDREAFRVTSDPRPGRVRFVPLREEVSHTIWPQDPFVVLERTHDTPLLLTPSRFERADDAAMTEALASELGWTRVRSELLFEGGNIVSDGATAFIGANTIAVNRVELGLDESEVVRRFERTFGLPVLVVGGLPQIVPHIDMVLTPLGGRRLALADAKHGAEIAQSQLEDHPDVVRAFERKTQTGFFAHPAIAEIETADGRLLRPPELEGATERAIRDSIRLGVALDAMAAALDQRGYIVERIPILLVDPAGVASERGVEIQDYPTLSYNNVLLSGSDAAPRVHLPRYGFAALDAAARDAWTSLGFTVERVPGFAISALYGGALRCSVKVLKRERP